MQQETQEVVFELRKPRWLGGEVIEEIPFTAHRSKWGWHPVSYEDFLILRDLHRLYWKTLRVAYAWQRWARKAPQNRVVYTKLYAEAGPHAGAVNGRCVVGDLLEPQVDPLFIDNSTKSEFFVRDKNPLFRNSWGRTHHCLFTPRLGAQVVNPNRQERKPQRRPPGIVEDFNLARMPQQDPEKLAPLDMTFYREVWSNALAGAV